MSDYDVLKSYGFSAFKASEIALDVARGDWYAAAVLKHARAIVCQYQGEPTGEPIELADLDKMCGNGLPEILPIEALKP